MDSLIDHVFNQSIETKRKFLEAHKKSLLSAIASVCETLRSGNKILIFGNGGSAADAQHIAAEFVGRYQGERKPLAAVALTTDTSILTAVSNDYSYDEVFVRQIKALGRKGDLAWAISTSGNSRNVIKAIQSAKEMGLRTLGMTGKDGGELAGICEISLVVPSQTTSRIQETHILLAHLVCEAVDLELFGVRGDSSTP